MAGKRKVRYGKGSASGTVSGRGRKRPRYVGSYPYEFRIRAVKLYLEEGLPRRVVCEELGIASETLSRWLRRYRELGEGGLKAKPPTPAGSKVSPAVKQQITNLKKDDPGLGVKRISQLLCRRFFLRASPETVRKTLGEQGLMESPKRRPRKSPKGPRFFERATPNQLWQSDIFTFRLGGKAAYIIAFMDDYSRYLVGLGLYRSQTAESVLEVFRRAVGDYGVPKEMLTDNGRQYTNWRGTTRFEKELQKDRIKHIRSRPHHPMTLGKVERFWRTIYTEFLSRAQFEDFDEARQRVSFWVKYYNHKRPHQGIGGLCPADRFFEIQHQLKKELERGVEENALELALRGRPKSPFYMVGRMGDQSVVIRAEKGKVKMLLDGTEPSQELEYQLERGAEDGQEGQDPEGLFHRGEAAGGAVGLEREETADGGLPGACDQVDRAEALAEQGVRGHDQGPGAPESLPGGEASAGSGARAAACPPAGQGKEAAEAAERDPEGDVRRLDEAKEAIWEPGLAPGRADLEGPDRTAYRYRGGPSPGGFPQDLLPVGEAGAERDDGGSLRQTSRPAGKAQGPGEGGAKDARFLAGEGALRLGGEQADPPVDGGHPLPPQKGPDKKKEVRWHPWW